MNVRQRWIAVMALLLAGGAWMGMAAQESIDALVKRCENLDNVTISIMRNRHPETKEVTRSVVNITIPVQSNQALIDDFVAAFQKEREHAEQEMESRENGKVKNLFYRFEKKSHILAMDNEGKNVVVTIMENASRGRREQKRDEREQRRKKEE